MTSRVWVYTLAIVVLGLGTIMTLRLTGGYVGSQGLAGEVVTKSASDKHSAEPAAKGLDTLTAAEENCSELKGAYLTEADAGTEFRLVVTSRFGFCLNEVKYPLSELQTSGCPFGRVSNWSQRGPDRYPIGFEITGTGECEVRNRDFWVRIVGITYEEAHGG